MAERNVLTVRVSAELQERLDAIADVIDRPKSWVINRALEAFVKSEAWQIEEIKRGLAEVDAGEFASEAEVGAMFEKWRRVDPDAISPMHIRWLRAALRNLDHHANYMPKMTRSPPGIPCSAFELRSISSRTTRV